MSINNEPATDYRMSASDAKELAGAVVLPAEFRLQALTRMADERGMHHMLGLFAQVLGMANALAVNAREMVEMIAIEEGWHPYTAEKMNLPTMFGALEGVQLAAKVKERATCNGCAYRLGSAANMSPVTVSDALYCQGDIQPFYCHVDLDSDGNPTKPCAGHAQAMRFSTNG